MNVLFHPFKRTRLHLLKYNHFYNIIIFVYNLNKHFFPALTVLYEPFVICGC